MKQKLLHIQSLLAVMLCVLMSATLTACGDDDEPNPPSNVPQGVHEMWISVMDSNYGELPGTATTLYEDDEFQYKVAVRNRTFELIILPFYKVDGEWVAAYKYDPSKNVGQQLTPLKKDAWLCSISRSGSVSSIEEINSKINPSASVSKLSAKPFQWKDGFYGYITTSGGHIVNVRLFNSFLKYDRSQESLTYGCIQTAKMEYEFF